MNNTLEMLLNRSIPFEGEKIRLLDQVTQALCSSDPSQINSASQIWKTLSDDPNFWLQSDQILVNSTNNHTKFLTLVLMENSIKQRWLALPFEEREGIKAYIVSLVLKLGGASNLDKNMESLLSKANSILVQIVKYEWNTTWKSFIPDICAASKTDLNLCQNNLSILKMLSEEIFEFSKNQLTMQQIAELKQHMNQEFTKVFELCDEILRNADKVSPALSKSCLETLYSFLGWIPIFYIFFSDIIQRIVQFVSSEAHREPALRCLIEIVSLKIADTEERVEQIRQKIFLLLKDCLVRFQSIPMLNETIDRLIANKQNKIPNVFQFEISCQNIARFLCSILQEQYEWLVLKGSATQMVGQEVRNALNWLVRLMQMPFDQTYRMIVEFFHFFAKKVKEQGSVNKPLLYSRENIGDNYPEIFEEVKKIIILRMAKPQEVLIVIDDNGQPMREELANTENYAMYELMRELLIIVAEMSWSTTRSFIVSKIEKQNTNEFSFDILNSLSWAVGSMYGNIPEQEQKPFLISVIRTLLHLCEAKKGKENKAVVASCIMYVVGQYPGFLKSNWNFLKTVVKKLFEFMRERFPGVMDMACNTFLKIAQNTSEQFVKLQEGDSEPYICDLIRRIPEDTSELNSDSFKLLFYEAIGHIISSEPRLEVKTNYIRGTLGHYYDEYNQVLTAAQTNPAILKDENVETKIHFFLRINERLASSIGLPYGSFLVQFNDTLNKLFIYYCGETERAVETQGKGVLNYLTIKRMKAICKEILKLYNTYIGKCININETEASSVIDSFVLPLVNFLPTFNKAIPEVKQAEFLSLLTTIFERLSIALKPDLVSAFLSSVFQSTLAMITTDFNSFPEHRTNFFSLLKAIIKHNFQQLYNMPQDKFHTIMNCIVWSIKHELSTFSDLGLDLLFDTLENLTRNPHIINIFYQRYYLSLMCDIFEVLTDGFHKSGFKMHCRILFCMCRVLVGNYLSIKVGGDSQTTNNWQFVLQYLTDKLSGAFHNVSKQDTMNKLARMMQTQDEKQFRAQTGDYLVMINRYTSAEQQDLQSHS